ncbi:MAG: STAS domain-containing protein [Candidatus Sulfotelmatobacter sp.]
MSDQRASNLSFAIERYDDLIVVHCSGRLVSGVNQQLNVEVGKLLPGAKRIVLDFEHLTHMDSSGLGALVRLYVHAKSAGCTLEVANMGKSIRNLLGVTHLLSILQSVGENHIRMG